MTCTDLCGTNYSTSTTATVVDAPDLLIDPRLGKMDSGSYYRELWVNGELKATDFHDQYLDNVVAKPGDKIKIKVNELNSGSAPALAHYLRFVLERTYDDSHMTTVLDKTVPAQNIQPGKDIPYTFTYTVPDSAKGCGKYIMWFYADSDDNIDEDPLNINPSREDNNEDGPWCFSCNSVAYIDLMANPQSIEYNTDTTLSWWTENIQPGSCVASSRPNNSQWD
ncbi:MAG: hypothetical protein GWP09_03175, partial [Nitrospiraceae bacterium]|nr:hypothetical protein [Nitrospiraceae bacterium]